MHSADFSAAIPGVPRGMVARPRLDRVLDTAVDFPVTLICAPAGSGKSVAANAWARRALETHPVGWLSCGSFADDPTAFWSALVGAVAASVAVFPGADLDPPPAPVRRPGSRGDRMELLDALLTWMQQLPDGTTVVCDDFSEIGAATTQRDLQYVIDRLPSALHLVIIARAYPPLAVHRARLEGRLLEVRGVDLAFTLEETGDLLAANDLRVGVADRERLHQRTEGWAAGLRLAVLSMTHAEDVTGVIHRLAGSTEAVSGYLTEQVLRQLDADDRDFLLDTCVVDLLNSDLVEALTNRPGGHADLVRAADQVGFLTRTEDSEPTYRFHPMFAELLRSELQHSEPGRAARQHRRAGRWYGFRGLPLEAVRHAQLGGDWDAAARVLALNAISVILRGRMAELIRLLGLFPQDVAAADPRLALVHAIPVVFGNDPDRAEALLDRARAGLPRGGDLDARRLLAITSYVETMIARYRGDTAKALSALDPAGPNIPGPDDTGFSRNDLDLRAAWRSTRAVGLMWADQRELAMVEARAACRDVRNGAAAWSMVAGLGVQAWLNALDGHLVAADELLDEVAPHVTGGGGPESPYAALAEFASAWIAMERGQLDQAERALSLAERSWRRASSSAAGVTGRILQARLLLLNGGPSAAVEVLDSAVDAGPRLRSRLLEQLAASVRVEIQLSRGELALAVEAAREGSRTLQAYVQARCGAAADDMTYGDHELGLQLRTLLAHAVNLHQLARLEGADRCLDAALDLTAAEGYRLPFLQFGVRAHALLIDARLAALRHAPLVAELLGATAPSDGRGAELTDPLSPRELDVLRHLVAGMDTDEIAGDLFVSRNTVRTHTKSIYRKLSVQNKRDAVLRAAALGIV